MARRLLLEPIISLEQLARFTYHLSMLSVDGVESVYQTTHLNTWNWVST